MSILGCGYAHKSKIFKNVSVYKLVVFNQTYMRFHCIQERTSTAMEAITQIAADKIMTTSMATTVPRGYCAQRPHTGRQNEVFPIALQENPSWHWSVLQLNNLPRGVWMLDSPCPVLPLVFPGNSRSSLWHVHGVELMEYKHNNGYMYGTLRLKYNTAWSIKMFKTFVDQPVDSISLLNRLLINI